MIWFDSITLTDYLILGVIILVLLYIYVTWDFDIFTKKGIPFRKPIPLFGNVAKNILRRQSLADFILEIYNAFPNHKVAGVFQLNVPTYMIRDPEWLKMILVKDFDHFADHFDFVPEGAEPLFSANLFTLKGQKWKHMRSLLSPAFTSSKMKGMFHLVSQCGQQLADHLHLRLKDSDKDDLELNMKDLFTRFTNDVIATSAFGISCDSLKYPTNEFYMCGKDISNFDGLRSLVFIGYLLTPSLMKLFKVGMFTKKSSNFLYKTVAETIKIREEKGIVRPDMIHLLMQAKRGELKDEEDISNGFENIDTSKSKPVKFDLTDTDITAQAMIFFLAGFDTASVLLSFASVLLAMHPDIQQRLQEEIDQTLSDCGGKITYDALHNMKYMDMVISETLRLYPPNSSTDRECVKTYTLPATDNTPAVTLKPKDQIFIPVYGLHHDPQYFPDPEKFDPERFSDENKHNIKPFTYMPFGLGPRSCIGNRFALMENKVALTYLLSEFSLYIIEKSPVPIKLAPTSFQMVPEKGFWLGLKSRRK